MKKILNLLFLMPLLAIGQNQNYVKTTTYKVPVTASLQSPSISQADISITYFDGLGRPVQQRAHRQSNTGKDIVTHIAYDAWGRQNKNYLPFVSQSASLDYSTAAASDIMQFYGSPTFALTGNPNFEATSAPYSETLFEASPLQRVKKQASPGESWKMPSSGDPEDHTLKIEKESNLTADAVKHFTALSGPAPVNGCYPVTFSQLANYAEGDLYKTIIKNENWVAGKAHSTEEYRDKDGQVILRRTFGESIINGQPVYISHDTYYVYDQYGNISFIIPPLSDGSQSQHDTLCYQYRYDKRNRLVEKKLPGKDWEFIIYDKSDGIVAVGPAYSPFGDQAKGWLIKKHDMFGRTAYSAWYNGHAALSSENRNAMQALMDASPLQYESRLASNTVDNIQIGYSNSVFPTGNIRLLDVSYYDNYSFPYALPVPESVEGQQVASVAKGMPTGSWTRVLTSPSENRGNMTTVFYDHYSHVIKNFEYMYNDAYTNSELNVDPFTGRINYTVSRHKAQNSNSEITTRNFFSYSSQGRLLKHTHSINNDPVQLLAAFEYDELGRQIRKKVGRTAENPLQAIDYSYNTRGWLKGINNVDNLSNGQEPLDLFAFKIGYDAVENNIAGVEKLYNGNVSETYWRSASDNIKRKYSYRYDHLNRLKDAIYQKSGQIQNSYNESMTYDMNGNIMTLVRTGALDSQNATVEIDNLEYTYKNAHSNRLMKVYDGSRHQEGFEDDSIDGISDPEDDYDYDDFGNLTKDQNKKILNISYNHLNLPVKILFEGDRTIEYLYDARGKKLQKSIGNSSTRVNTDYISGFQYQRGVLQFFHTAEGYVNCTKVSGTDNYHYVFNYVDHLGNIRMSYGIDPATNVLKIIEENHYYPFGLKHSNYNSASLGFQDAGSFVALKATAAAPTNPGGGGNGEDAGGSSNSYRFKFNGQELQTEFSLNMTAMDYRQYDHALGRFNGMDMLAELVPETSPYRFANNNPNFWSDPTGLIDIPEVYVPSPDHGMSSFGGISGDFGLSIPNFFSWGNAQNEGMGIPPLANFLGIAGYLPYDMTKVTIQLETVEVQGKTSDKSHKFSKQIRKYSSWSLTLQKPLGNAYARATRYSSQMYKGNTVNVMYQALGKRITVPLGEYDVAAVGKSSNALKIAGKTLGIVAVGAGVVSISQEGLNWSNGLDTSMALLALSPTGIGQGIAAVYFIVNAGTEYFTGQDIGQHIQNAVNGN